MKKLLFLVPLALLLMGSTYNPSANTVMDSLGLRNSADTFTATFVQPTLTANRTYTLPDADAIVGGDIEASLAVLTSATVDLATSTFVDVTVPSGTAHIKDFMIIAVTNVTINGSIKVGIAGDTSKYYNNVLVRASSFSTTDDADLFSNPSSHTGTTVFRITPNGSGAGTIKLKITVVVD